MKNQILRFSATEVARDFSHVLDLVEGGAVAIIERHGKPVARIGPAWFTPRRVSECREVPWSRPSATPEPGFARDLEEIIKGHPAAEPPAWD